MISDQTKPYMYTLCYNYMAPIYRCLADGKDTSELLASNS